MSLSWTGVALSFRSIGTTSAMAAWLLSMAASSSAQPTATWTLVEPTGPAARSGHVMVYEAARQRTLLFGGQDANGIVLGDAWTWDGTAWTRLAAEGPAARTGAALAYDGARNVAVLFGGRDADGTELGDTWEWDGTSWHALAPPAAPAPRSFASMAWDAARGVAVLFGGATANQKHGDTWTWDGFTWILTATTGPPARSSAAVAYDTARGVVVLMAGSVSDIPWRDTWEWNGTAWTKSTPTHPYASIQVPRDACLTYDTARQVAVLFGDYGRRGESYRVWERVGTDWQQGTGSGPAYRTRAALVFDAGRGVCVLFGGSSSSETWEWNGSIWTLRTVNAPSARENAAFCFDSDRNVALLYGGDTWTWDGMNWQLRGAPTASPVPPSPWSHEKVYDATSWAPRALAYDAARHVAVIFGEYWCYKEWERGAKTLCWDGDGWQVNDSAAPPRNSYSMAYDEARQVVVRFGGGNLYYHPGDGNETWEWAGGDWEQRAVGGTIPPAGGKIAYDVSRSVTVLFGTGGETWEWDGQTWTAVATEGPGVRSGFALAYDRARSRVVLFGGLASDVDPPERRNDLWQWTGRQWVAIIGGETLPPPCSGHAMTYDTARDEFLVFGGRTGADGLVCDDTWRLKIIDGEPADGFAPLPILDCGPPACAAGLGAWSLTGLGLVAMKWRYTTPARRRRAP